MTIPISRRLSIPSSDMSSISSSPRSSPSVSSQRRDNLISRVFEKIDKGHFPIHRLDRIFTTDKYCLSDKVSILHLLTKQTETLSNPVDKEYQETSILSIAQGLINKNPEISQQVFLSLSFENQMILFENFLTGSEKEQAFATSQMISIENGKKFIAKAEDVSFILFGCGKKDSATKVACLIPRLDRIYLCKDLIEDGDLDFAKRIILKSSFDDQVIMLASLGEPDLDNCEEICDDVKSKAKRLRESLQ